VPEEVAQQGQLNRDTQAALGEQENARLNAERSAGIVEGAKAFVEGAADTLSFGLFGAGRELLDPEGARTMRIRAEERGGARFLGEAAALAVPGLGEAGALGRAGRVAEYTAPGIARSVGRSIGGRAGQFTEGAILGTGGYISSTNITGDPLTIEAAVESATIGGLLEVGFNVAANKIEGVTWGIKRSAAEHRRIVEIAGTAKRAKEVFTDTPPSWNEFVDLHTARKKAVQDFNKEVAREAKKYNDFWQNNTKLTEAIDSAQEAVNAVRNDVYAKQGGPFAGTPETVKYRFNKAGQAETVEHVYERGRIKYDFDGNPNARTTVTGPEGEQIPGAQGAPRVRQVIYDADGRPVISNETLEKLREYERRISRVYKIKSGGYRIDESGRWIRDASVPPDPQRALEELRAIKQDFMGWRSKYSGIIHELPTPPRTPLTEIPGELPKSIEDFARKHMDQVNEIANSINDPQMATALERVMKDLDLLDPTTPRSAAENLSELHRVLRDYRDKMKEFAEYEAKEKAKAEAMPGILKWIHRAARYVGGRAVDTGGAMGAFKRQVGGTAIVKGMTAVEGAVLGYGATGDEKGAALGAALMYGRLSLKQRIQNLIGKYGVLTAGLARKLASPMAYLATSFPSGEKDTETDPRKLAVNRAYELRAAAMAAPDAAFLAVQGMLGADGDIAWKMHQHVVGTLNYLVSTLPKDPGTDMKMFESNWTPQYHETVALAHRLEAVQDPLTAIARAIAGDSHPAATEALWAVYPSIMQELAQELSIAAPHMKNLTYEQASAYSNLFRTPLTGLQQPVVVMTIQGLYMKGPQQAAPPQGPAGGGASKKAVGRPPAVQSPVAGSNVANLTQ
jgi:hypothetical protein